ncbi:hypothetical protein B0H13DRAFT_659987 [Mycena leptocephala]|nr:hypothetical protein B0H13DRAFT_659987 [Mycena leptocephala]
MGTRCVLSARGFSAPRTHAAPPPRSLLYSRSTWTGHVRASGTRQTHAATALLHLSSQRTHLVATGNDFLLFPSLAVCCLVPEVRMCGRRRAAMGAIYMRGSPVRRPRARAAPLYSLTTSRHPLLALPSTSFPFVPVVGTFTGHERLIHARFSAPRREAHWKEWMCMHARRHIRARIPCPASTMLGPVALRDDVLVSSPRCFARPRCACAVAEGDYRCVRATS